MNYLFKLSIRNLKKKPAVNFINIFGLSLSMAVVILLSSYCYHELTTDKFQKNKGKAFLLINQGENASIGINTPGVLSEFLDSSTFEIQNTVRMAGFWEAPVVKAGSTGPFKSDILFTDSDFFDVFTYKVIKGNLSSALNDPKSIVLIKSEAERLFGKTDIVGEMVILNNQHLFFVSAVIEEPASNSFLKFGGLVPMSSRSNILDNGEEFTNWGWWNFQTFILTRENPVAKQIEDNIENIFIDHSGREAGSEHIRLLPLADIYFSKIESGWMDYIHIGNKQQVSILAMVAFLILLIAIINFINISSSQYFDRLKQAGLQKLMGASRSHVVRNILLESFLLFFLSAWIAIVIAEIAQVYLNQYLGIQFVSGVLFSPGFLMLTLSFTAIISIIASLSPALIIARSRPVDNLKKTVRLRTKKSTLRSVFVISQFTIAIILICFTILVQKQINFGINNLGFKKENIVGIKLTPQLSDKKEVLKKELLDQTYVKKLSFTQYFPGRDLSYWGMDMDIHGEDKQVSFYTFDADGEFFEMLNLESVKGRLYSKNLITDKNKAVVNETFLKTHNIIDPIGILFNVWGSEFEIIGVVKDFHFESVNRPIEPLLIKNTGNASFNLVNIQSTDFNEIQSTISELKEICYNLSPDFPVEFRFMDLAVENMYQSEVRFRRIFTLFAGCAIFISCLGILALSIFVCQNKTKEIGIRKTYGATIRNIFSMLNQEFIRWIVIAFLISGPASWYIMYKWLEVFSYKTDISWWIFAVSGSIALGIALLSVSWQTYRSARKNPVEVLRYE